MVQSAVIEFIYGAFLIVGGVMGYKFAGSLPSLLGGVGTGLIMLLCGVETARKKRYATTIALLVAILLMLFFGYGFIKTTAFRNAVMTLITVFVIILLSIRLTQRRYRGGR